MTPPASARRAFAALTAVLLLAVPAARAAEWTVVRTESRIGFSGTHAGKAFAGTFERWQATIAFDPASPAKAKVRVTVDLASARTGDRTYDGTLPGADWLDVARGPEAVFETGSVRDLGGGRFEADGTLSLRGTAVPVMLAFTLAIEGDTARMTGRAGLKRLDFGIGKGSDATGAWVSLDIPIEVAVVARRR